MDVRGFWWFLIEIEVEVMKMVFDLFLYGWVFLKFVVVLVYFVGDFYSRFVGLGKFVGYVRFWFLFLFIWI